MARPLAVTAGVFVLSAAVAVAPVGGAAAAVGAVARPLQPYEVRGTPVDGASGPAGAPKLVPGRYTDTLPNAGDDYGRNGPATYYAVDLAEGETPHLSATAVPEARPNTDDDVDDQVLLTAALTAGGADDSDCSIEETSSGETSTQDKIPTTSIALTTGAVGGEDWPSGCPTSGTFFFTLSRNFGGDGEMPTEITFRLEPPVGNTADLPAAAVDGDDPPLLPTPASDVEDVAGGSSFDTAPRLESGRTYRDSIVFGEDRYFRVPLTWGQRFAFRFDTEQLPGSDSTDGPYTEVIATNPLRALLSDVDTQSDTGDSFLGGQTQQLSGGSTVPVRWANRTSTADVVAAYALDGDYYLVFTAGYDSSGAQSTVPYTVTVEVTGDSEPGPAYRQAPGGNGAESNGAAEVETRSDGWTTRRVAVVAGAGAAGLVAAIVLGVLVVGRRRPRPGGPLA